MQDRTEIYTNNKGFNRIGETKMNMKYMTYAAAVEAIASGFFDENNKYMPGIGKGNTVRVYCQFITDNEEAKELNLDEMGAFEYVDAAMKLVGDEFADALKDDDYFSFGRAVKDAEKIVEHRKAKIAHENKFEEALEAIIKKVNEIDKNVNPEDIKKVLDALKEQKPLNEKTIVEEYWQQKLDVVGEDRA